jgi:predicted RecA/RadA family phage recombinase
MRNFKQPGDVLTFVAPEGGVVSGGAYIIEDLFVIAAADAAEDEEFEGQITGVFELPKTSAQAWVRGEFIYWDPTPGVATTTAAGGHLIGAAAKVAANPSATGEVRLNGTTIPAAGA